jgi:hypothetical protein
MKEERGREDGKVRKAEKQEGKWAGGFGRERKWQKREP